MEENVFLLLRERRRRDFRKCLNSCFGLLALLHSTCSWPLCLFSMHQSREAIDAVDIVQRIGTLKKTAEAEKRDFEIPPLLAVSSSSSSSSSTAPLALAHHLLSTSTSPFFKKKINNQPDLEWKLTYVGSAESEKYDQVLDSVLVGPVFPGQYRFVFQVRGEGEKEREREGERERERESFLPSSNSSFHALSLSHSPTSSSPPLLFSNRPTPRTLPSSPPTTSSASPSCC